MKFYVRFLFGFLLFFFSHEAMAIKRCDDLRSAIYFDWGGPHTPTTPTADRVTLKLTCPKGQVLELLSRTVTVGAYTADSPFYGCYPAIWCQTGTSQSPNRIYIRARKCVLPTGAIQCKFTLMPDFGAP
jgi:hypothetical protein